jgi:endonuclease/exonuclease/phosphatase (EEP) superfamily protein YafD
VRTLLNAFGGALLTVSVLLSALALAADFTWLGELAANLRWHLGVLAAAALPLLALGGARWRAAVATVLVVWNLGPALVLLWQPAPPVQPGSELRLASANLYAGNRKTVELETWLASESPDILVLLEVSEFWRDGINTIAPPDAFPYRVLEPRLGAFGIALLSRYPLLDVQVRELGDPGVPYIHAIADVDGCALPLWAIHTVPPVTPAMRSARDRQLSVIGAEVAGEAVAVVAGDVNVTLYSDALQRLLERGGLLDSRVGEGRAPSWMPMLGPLGLDLDHVLVKEGVGVRSRRLGPNFGSDHLPVVADLVIASGACAAPPRAVDSPATLEGSGGAAPREVGEGSGAESEEGSGAPVVPSGG